MIERDTKNSETNSFGKISEAVEISPTSDDFQETLLKSGLDAAALQNSETANENLSAEKNSAVYSINFAADENEPATIEPAQDISEMPEKNRKVLPRFKRWQQLTAIGGIAAIIVLQSVFQFSFIQTENQRLAEKLTGNDLPVVEKIEKNIIAEVPRMKVPETAPKPKVAEKTAYRKADAKVLTPPKKSAPKIQNEIRETPARTASQKKEPRETNAERLRRAEKILTGV